MGQQGQVVAAAGDDQRAGRLRRFDFVEIGQGTAADVIKIAMIDLHNALGDGSFRSRLLLQVHDELVLEAPEDEIETVAPLVRQVMCDAFDLTPPLKVGLEVGQNWLDMEGIGDDAA